MRLFEEGCRLVILACNTASAKALRNIQQKDLPLLDPSLRVLGVIRPTVEVIDHISRTKHVGVLGTTGTISSQSYTIEINNLFPHITVTGEACPMWVPLVENKEFDSPGADYFVQKHLEHILSLDPAIDTLILGCTHYPLLLGKIKAFLPPGITLFAQGERVAESLTEYLIRHPEMDRQLTKQGARRFLTTESVDKFTGAASLFLNQAIEVEQITLN
jgi:glutamate racemase